MEREIWQQTWIHTYKCRLCAIGIGNVWRFPYVAGNNGGGIFVLLYMLFLLMFGIPVLSMELAMGRASKKAV